MMKMRLLDISGALRTASVSGLPVLNGSGHRLVATDALTLTPALNETGPLATAVAGLDTRSQRSGII